MRSTLLAFFAALAALSCSDSTPPRDCTANTGSVNASVAVTQTGIVFDWTPACAVALLLVEEDGSDMWVVAAPNLSSTSTESSNIILPPITYGVAPSGTDADPPQTLIAGRTYDLVLWKVLAAGATANCQQRNGNACLLAVKTFTR
jgi:hypothetical protein